MPITSWTVLRVVLIAALAEVLSVASSPSYANMSLASVPFDQNTGTSYFGYSVAMTDQWALVGAPHGAKKAFAFSRNCTCPGTVNNHTSMFPGTCDACPSGKFSDESGFRFACKDCPFGKSNAGTSNVDCASCPSGRFVKSPVPLVCDICQRKL